MSTESDTSANPLERYHDKSCRDLLGDVLREDNLEWLVAQDHGVDPVVRLERLRQENPEAYTAIIAAIHDDDGLRKVLAAVAAYDGTATYDTLEPFVTFSRRTLKRRVWALQDDGVLEVDPATRPATITFTNDAVKLLAEHALHVFVTT